MKYNGGYSIQRFVIALVTMTCTSVITLALITFNPCDPSPFYITDSGLITNILGNFGATLAAWLVMLLGSAAFLLIALGVFVSYHLVLQKEIAWERIAASCALVIICAVYGSFLNKTWINHHAMPGGIIGFYGCTLLKRIADPFLIHLMIVIMMLICFVFAFQMSFVVCIQYGIHALRYIAHLDRWLLPIMRFAWHYSCIIARALVRICCHIKQLVSGNDFAGQKPSICMLIFEEYDDGCIICASYEHDANIQRHNELSYASVAKEPAQENEVMNTPKEMKKTQEKSQTYALPSAQLLKKNNKLNGNNEQEQQILAQTLEEKLARFGITGCVISIKTGPVVTLFEYQPDIDAKISKIIALEDDLALALQALSIRIIAPIPGRSVVGFEVANKTRSMVYLGHLLADAMFKKSSGAVPFVLGVDTIGSPVVVDLAAMPHLLIAGSTGSGKSVALNVMLVSLLYRFKPEELKLILIDPKRLEFAPYADIPHLLFPIVTNPKDAAPVLQWVITQMEERYEKMAQAGVRNCRDYNVLAQSNERYEPLPLMVVMIDELADLMMVAGKQIEEKIARVAQMARAAGIHLVVATQRPSVDVITGVIKANFPTRISFRVATKIDSRTILDSVGADKLLGNGDMLYLDARSTLQRIHGAFVSDEEIHAVCSYVRSLQTPAYHDLTTLIRNNDDEMLETDRELFADVLAFLDTVDEISISLLQRRFRIGYNRSARIIEMLEMQGYLANDGGKMRKVVR